ncbi:hypothetical protein Lal_00011349 [Lupinus albus]|nr:hypothetical protein Lal_00011349 [Lupinus albus]
MNIRVSRSHFSLLYLRSLARARMVRLGENYATFQVFHSDALARARILSLELESAWREDPRSSENVYPPYKPSYYFSKVLSNSNLDLKFLRSLTRT